MSKDNTFPKKTPTRLPLAEQKRVVYSHEALPGHTIEHVADPKYWTHVQNNLNMGDRIEITAENFSFYAEFMVVGKGPLGIKLKEMYSHELDDADLDENRAPEGVLTPIWRGPSLKWCVEQGDERVKTNLNSKGDAQNWIDQRARVEAA